MIDWKEKFKESSIGGFTLHVSPPQIQCLIQVYVRETAKCWDTSDINTFISSVKALIRKGLVMHEETALPNNKTRHIWYVTDAGKLLLQMLNITDIVTPKMLDSAVARAKEKNFKF